MRIDPSVVLCMLSRALRSLPLVSERSLPLLPSCTLNFFFTVFFNVDSKLKCYWVSRELYIIDRHQPGHLSFRGLIDIMAPFSRCKKCCSSAVNKQ